MRNRFEGQSDSNDDSTRDVNRVNRQSVKKNKVGGRKKKILLLASSHGRGCSKLIGERLGEDFQVCGVVKPNGKFKDVVESVDKMTEDFGKDDCVIVMAGGNDEDDSPFQEGISKGIENIMKVKVKTNVIINALPPRYDRLDLSEKVKWMNKFLHGEVNRQGNFDNRDLQINFEMERMDRRYFTYHGLHLNREGKRVFSERMCKLIKDIERKTLDKQIDFLGN